MGCTQACTALRELVLLGAYPRGRDGKTGRSKRPLPCSNCSLPAPRGHGSITHFLGTLIFRGLAGFAATTKHNCTDKLPTDAHYSRSTLRLTQGIHRPSCNNLTLVAAVSMKLFHSSLFLGLGSVFSSCTACRRLLFLLSLLFLRLLGTALLTTAPVLPQRPSPHAFDYMSHTPGHCQSAN